MKDKQVVPMLGGLLCGLFPANGVTLASNLTFDDWSNGNTVAVISPGYSGTPNLSGQGLEDLAFLR